MFKGYTVKQEYIKDKTKHIENTKEVYMDKEYNSSFQHMLTLVREVVPIVHII